MPPATQQRRLPLGLFADKAGPRLYDRTVEVLRVHPYSRRTEQAYVHFERGEITVCEGKGDQDRVTTMPGAVAHRTVQELLGHKDVRTTMIHTHALNRGGRGVRSPADGLARCADERQAQTAYHARRDVTTTQPLAITRLRSPNKTC